MLQSLRAHLSSKFANIHELQPQDHHRPHHRQHRPTLALGIACHAQELASPCSEWGDLLKARHVGLPRATRRGTSAHQARQGEARRPTKRGLLVGVERPTQGEARRPTKSDKARHVGPPSCLLVVPNVRHRETNSRRGASAHQERQGEARRPTKRGLLVGRDLLKARHVGPPRATRRGTSAHQARSIVGRDQLKARHVGPPRATR